MNTPVSRFLPAALVASLIAAALVMLQAPTVSSAPAANTFDINVDTTADEFDTSGSGTGCALREAIESANNNVDFGGCTRLIYLGSTPPNIFLPSGSYTLTLSHSGNDNNANGDLNLYTHMTISATGAALAAVTVDPGWDDRVFHVITGTQNVTIKGLSISDGSVTGSGGGGLLMEPGTSLVMKDSVIAHNQASYGGGIQNNGSLTLVNTTIFSNTATSGSIAGGGGIFSGGPLTLTDSTVSSNSASVFGGGITNGGPLVLINSSVNGNKTADKGGGIWNSGTLTVTSSHIMSNTATSDGGGIYVWGTATLTNSSVLSNTASYGGGGGIYNFWNNSKLIINNSTVSSNTAYFDGGGIYNSGISSSQGTLIVSNSTLSGNSDTGIANQGTLTLTGVTLVGNIGGGLLNDYGTAMLTNVTLSHNSGHGVVNYQGIMTLTHVTVNVNSGSGLYQNGSHLTETIRLLNTIIANNTASNCYVYAIPLQSYGHNLSSDGSCTPYFTWPGDLNNTNPKLAPLADNGGGTRTHALQPGSPAIDAIPFATNGCGTTLATDQRGINRPFPAGGNCDIGAYELIYTKTFLPLVLK